MDLKSVIAKVKDEGKAFLDEAGKASERVYLVLLTLYVGLYYILRIAWEAKAEEEIYMLKYAVLGIVIWGAALYLFMVIASCRKLWDSTFRLVITGAAILAVTAFLSTRMSTNSYGVVMDVFFCLMAYKKDFRKILRCLLGVNVSMLILAGIGMAAGFTLDMGKPDTAVPGYSLGINYPNTWGYLVFLGLIMAWYLYFRYRYIFTFVLFWAVSAFMYFFITCRTIAGLTFIFPVLALFVGLLEKHGDKKASLGKPENLKIVEWAVILIPFLAWAFMMFSSYQVDWWYRYYHGPLRNLAWRFIQGGLYFRTYGLPIIGNPYRSNVYTYVNVQGEFIKVGILDSSFAAYIIMRGLLWLTYTLLWLCVAHWKALKKRDYAIIMLETILLGFAMMERPGLDLWYNFILLYPLASVMSKPGTGTVFEFFEKTKTAGDGCNTAKTEGICSGPDDSINSFLRLKVLNGWRKLFLYNSVEQL